MLYAVRRRAASSTRTGRGRMMSRPANNANMQTRRSPTPRSRGDPAPPQQIRPGRSRTRVGRFFSCVRTVDRLHGAPSRYISGCLRGKKKAEGFQRLSKRTKERRSSYTPLLTDTQEGTVVDVSCPSLLSLSLSFPVSRNSVVDEYVVVDLRFLKGTPPTRIQSPFLSILGMLQLVCLLWRKEQETPFRSRRLSLIH